MAQIDVGFILARRFTLCALGNFVDVLRLAADEGDPMAADPLRLARAFADDGTHRASSARRLRSAARLSTI